MPKRLSEITSSLRQLGEIQVTDWDFMGLLNKDIKDLEIGASLRKLGNKKVMDWDFKEALPAVHEFVHQEVDLVGWMKRAARYKVSDWDFKSASLEEENARPGESAEPDGGAIPGRDEMQEITGRLRNFLQFVTVNLIDEPERAEIRIQEIAPGVVRFNLVVSQKDLKTMLGREGATASAIRNLMKATAAADGANALLEIVSHEEQLAHSRREIGGR